MRTQRFRINGIVQGVGFRPMVYLLARTLRLGGWVRNMAGGVELELRGAAETIATFLERLPERLSAQAKIVDISRLSDEPLGPGEGAEPFAILESSTASSYQLSFPPDLAVCGACLSDIADPANRRFRYPFSTCTRCGPRYSVITEMPYDRERTTLGCFPLCRKCTAEYSDAADRRFHAESIACPACGPKLLLADARGVVSTLDPIIEARRIIAGGGIVALRSIGGFHLAVDPYNAEAVARLRRLKDRPHKPFAVMARDEVVVERYCEVPEAARALLSSAVAPAVVLRLRADVAPALCISALSPDSLTLGVLPIVSPLHWLLFQQLAGDPTPAFDLLVMTSGNRRGEPVCTTNADAIERLQGIADAFLLHNREISLRADDSLCVIQGQRAQVWRRARGYAPAALELPVALTRCVLGVGAELKNSIALGYDGMVTPSAHIGDLETPEAIAWLERLCEEFPRHLHRQPERIAVDLHPDMHATRIGRALAARLGCEVVAVQHHHAHAASAMVEHKLTECLALVFDGTGYGPDGSIWGGELLAVDLHGYERLGTFAPALLPGGDAAVRFPVRQAFARAQVVGRELPKDVLSRHQVRSEELSIWRTQSERHINTPQSSAVGRLFDAAAVLLHVAPREVSYEGQAAICLEELAYRAESALSIPHLEFGIELRQDLLEVSWREVFSALLEHEAGRDAEWAFAFHRALAQAACRLVIHGLARTGKRAVVASGGVFCNRLLTRLVSQMLCDQGVDLLIHAQLPPNDGGLAVGQVLVGGVG